MTNILNSDLTEEIVDEVLDQMDAGDNLVYSLDCLELHPEIKAQINNSAAVFELQIFTVTVNDEDVFLVWSEDGDFTGEDVSDFTDRASFHSTEAEARVALADEYRDWQSRF